MIFDIIEPYSVPGLEKLYWGIYSAIRINKRIILRYQDINPDFCINIINEYLVSI